MSVKERAEKLLASMGTTFLATHGPDGHPNVRALSVLKYEGLKTAWFMTGDSCDKIKELQKNPKCMVYATTMEDNKDYTELRLWGTVEILNDVETRSALWREEYSCYFPQGKDDPTLRVLKFTASSGAIQSSEGPEKLSF